MFERFLETETPTLGVGIDVGTSTTTCAVTDGRSSAAVDGPTGAIETPTSIEISDAGIRIPESIRAEQTIKPLPRYERDGCRGQWRESPTDILALTHILRECKPAWEGNVAQFISETSTGGARAFTRNGSPSDLTVAAFSVPGAYSRDDISRVRRAATAAGFDPSAIVRAPVGAAAAHLPALDERTTAVVVDMGVYWCNVGIVTLDPDRGTVDVIARSSVPSLGRDTLDEVLARALLERAAQEREEPLEFTSDGLDVLVRAVHEALDEASADGTVNLESTVPVSVDGHDEPLDLTVSLDTAEAYRLLESPIGDVFDRLDEILDAGEVARRDVDQVLVAGAGATTMPIRYALRSYFEAIPRTPGLGDPVTASAVGAAVVDRVLSAEGKATRSGLGGVVGRETAPESGAVRVRGADGLSTVAVYETSVALGEPQTVRVTTPVDNQLEGRFDVVTTHDVTGEPTSTRELVVSGIDPGPAGSIPLEITLTPTLTDVEVTVRQGDCDTTLQIDCPEEPTAEYLAVPGEDVSVDTLDANPDRGLATQADALPRSFDEIPPSELVDSVIELRNNLWQVTQRGDDSVDASSIDALLRKFDNSMTRQGVVPISPELGESLDPHHHRAVSVDTSEFPEGQICEVYQPGYRVDDRVVEPAQVVVSEGIESDHGSSNPPSDGTPESSEDEPESDDCATGTDGLVEETDDA